MLIPPLAPRMKTEYEVAVAEYASDLACIVNDMIRRGFEPAGGVVVSVASCFVSVTEAPRDVREYAQAMIRRTTC